MGKPLWDSKYEKLDCRGSKPFEDFDRWNPEMAEVLSDFLRALRRKKGFGLFFVQCSPARGERVITAIRERFPQKRLVKTELTRQSETLYGELQERYQAEQFDVACVVGLEQALYSYEDTKRLAGWSSEDIYSYSWRGVPALLSHLNRQREAFEANLPIALVFLVPSFAIDYFVQRAPDFFDWRSGFFKFVESSEDVQKASQELLGKDYQEYLALTLEQRRERLLEIKENILLLAPSDCEQKSNLLREQGRLFECGKDFRQALDCYNRALTVDPQNHKAWNSQGSLLSDLGRYEEAIESYDRALAIKPNDWSVLNNRGIALERLRRYEEAIESYDRALKIQPNICFIWHNRGNILGCLEKYKEAIQSYDRALKIQPDFYFTWHVRGHALHNLKRYKAAIKSYDRALEIQPDFYFAWHARGHALRDLERYREAIQSYDRALEIQPDFYFAWQNRGNSLHNLERYEEAIESYDRALEIKPDYHDVWNSRGYVLYQQGRHQEASDCFAKVTEIQPDGESAWNNIGYLALDRYSYGLQPIVDKPLLIRQVQDCSGSQTTTKIDLELCQKAIKFFDTALNLAPQFTIAWANRSFPAYYLQQYETALQSCDKALELDPKNEEEMNEVVCTNRGYILLQLDNPTAALQDFTTALKIDSQLAEAWIGHGTALYNLGCYAEALESFTQALNLNHPLAQSNLDFINNVLGNGKKAESKL